LPQYCGLSILQRLSPNGLNIPGRREKIISEMNCDHTWQRLVRIGSLVSICFLGFAVFDQVSARQQQPKVTEKSKGRPASREDVGPLLHEAALLLQTGKLEQAEPLVRRAVAAAPANADAHNLLGTILDQRGRTQAAEREYLAALHFNPRATSARANLGVLLARTERSEAAVAAFEAVLREVPDHPQATINLALLYAARGDYSRAVPLFERARRQQPDNLTVLSQLGFTLYQLKRIDEAAEVLASAASLSPADPDVLYLSGLVATLRGDSEAAVNFWQRALAQRADFAAANFMIGEELRKQRRYEGAVEFYERALKQDAVQLVYYVRLGGTYMLLVRYDRALDLFQRATKQFPASAEAQYFAGIAARGYGALEVAEAALRKSLALRESNVDALAQLGFVVGDRGRDAEAEKLLRRAVSLDPRHFYANYELGRLLVRTKRYEEAIGVLTGAARIREHDPSVHYQLFMTYTRLKRKADADRELAVFKQYDAESKARRGQGDEQIEDTLPRSPSDGKPE
jgi:Flp pilus assembly protein TadD